MPSHPTSIWRRSSNKLRQAEIWLDCFCFAGLFLGALILFLVNLGDLPLLDLEEGTVGQLAKEIYQGSRSSLNWVFPTLWGEPYLTPPLIPNLIAIAYKFVGVSEFATRLPGALLGCISVLLVYNIGREIFVARSPALFSALVYLTCLPVLRFSRLATLGGPILCFELLAIWAILRCRRDLRIAVVAGIALGLMGLTKGLLSIQILIILLAFLAWDTPRLISCGYFWAGLVLGIAPGVAWYLGEGIYYNQLQSPGAFFTLFMGRTNAQVFMPQTLLDYVLASLQYVLPWSLMILAGLRLVIKNIHWGWGKLLFVWIWGYFVLGYLLLNQDYWSILPLYPAIALAIGKQLDLMRNLPSYVDYPRFWSYGLVLMAVLAAFAGLYWGIREYIDFYLPFICGSLTITFAATAIALSHHDKQFIPLLFWGLFVSLLLLVVSPHWIWELKTQDPVKPVAQLIREYTPSDAVIYSSMTQDRPSLNFYSDRHVIPLSQSELAQKWQENSNIYLFIT
ncbi:family 39 glycosyl transferase [Chondrocystis sp. NIES-4102]|nr:family 39 glycosyl transferase [Chondrocystis sp. NIES-4102]